MRMAWRGPLRIALANLVLVRQPATMDRSMPAIGEEAHPERRSTLGPKWTWRSKTKIGRGKPVALQARIKAAMGMLS